MLQRLNVFWLGAGGFLLLFCVNEIIAYHLSRAPKWLGGPLVYGGMVVGALLGLMIMAFLGVEEPREASPQASAAASAPPDEGDGDASDDGKGESTSLRCRDGGVTTRGR